MNFQNGCSSLYTTLHTSAIQQMFACRTCKCKPTPRRSATVQPSGGRHAGARPGRQPKQTKRARAGLHHRTRVASARCTRGERIGHRYFSCEARAFGCPHRNVTRCRPALRPNRRRAALLRDPPRSPPIKSSSHGRFRRGAFHFTSGPTCSSRPGSSRATRDRSKGRLDHTDHKHQTFPGQDG
jgi:hypothetical protein